MSLGVQAPADIDLEAIAFTLQAQVRYRSLESCEARIIGFNDSAVITVDPSKGEARARFSIGHELGHWHYHRGRSSICRADEIGGLSHASPTHPERVADAYAADLLLPPYLFEPEAKKLKRATFNAVDELSKAFRASRTATALRLLEYGPEPAILVCHSINGRRWFRRSKSVPVRWFPVNF
jgi:Zn-dependent peptidase ImmA (M78 family)